MANIFDEELKRRTFGAADSDPSMFTGGALDALNTIAGGASRGQQAMELARALSPKPQEFDLATAALKYFTGLTREASKPGATLLGAAATATADPAEYLMDVKDYNRKLEDSLPQTAIKLASSLKPPKGSGTTTYKSIIIKMKDGTEKQDYVPVSDIPKIKALENVVSVLEYTAPKSGSTSFKAYGVSEENLAGLRTALNLPSLTTDADGNVLLTDSQAAIGQAQGLIIPKISTTSSEVGTPKQYSVSEENLAALNAALGTDLQRDSQGNVTLTPDQFLKGQNFLGAAADASGGPQTQLAKLYSDLEKAPIGSPERAAIQKQIDAEITKSGFDKELFEAETKILADYTKRTKELVEAEIAYNKLAEARNAKDGVGDLAMVFSFMKMLDPGSVVRESEFSAAQNTAGLFQKLQVAAESIKKGDLLSPKQRTSFLKLSKKFLEGGIKSMIKIRRNKGIQADNYGLNAANIFGYEPAPAQWYISDEAYEIAEGAGTTVEAAWLNKTPNEQAAWIAANGGS